MASIKGISLKSIKFIKLKDDYYGFTANIYLNNKKIGSCENLKFGQECIINLIKENEFKDIINDYYSNKEIDTSIFNKENLFINELIILSDIEKEFKKNIKKDISVTISLSSKRRGNLLIGYKEWNDDIETKFLKKYKPIKYTIYKNEKDFLIV